MSAVLLIAEQLRQPVPGGIGTYVTGLLKGLSELEEAAPDVTLYASRIRGPSDPLSRFRRPLVTSKLGHRPLMAAWDHRLFDVPGTFSVVHASSLATPPASAGKLSVFVPDLAWRHTPDSFPPRGRRWHESALRRVLARADAMVVASSRVADDLVAAGAAAAKVHVVALGSDHLGPPDADAAANVLNGLGVADEYVLTVGTLEPRKNLTRLLAAYHHMHPRLGRDVPLLVVGPRGWGPQLPSDPAQGAPGVGRVVFAGPVSGPALAALYERARLLAYVPLEEGFGLPPVEAMAAGCPVVASAVPSLGDAALEVDPTDVSSIGAGLLRVLDEEGVADDLRARGRVRAAQLTWAASALAHTELWRSLS